MALLTAVILGALAGTLGGFASGIALLQMNRFRNRLAEKRGEPPAKNLVMTKFHWPAAMLGALAGAMTAPRHETWLTLVCGAAAFPLVLFVLVLGALVVERVKNAKAGGG